MAELHWGLRASFREYVDAIEDSRVTRAGVGLDDRARAVFLAPEPPEADVWSFAGRMEFWAHHGVLDVRLHELQLDLGAAPNLSVGAQAWGTSRVMVGSLTEVENRAPRTREFVVRLTSGGVRLLGDVYAEGDLLDPVVLVTSSDTELPRW